MIVRLVYKTPRGKEITGKFIRTIRGYIPIVLDEVTYLDKSNKIIKEEELNLDDLKSESFL